MKGTIKWWGSRKMHWDRHDFYLIFPGEILSDLSPIPYSLFRQTSLAIFAISALLPLPFN